MSKSRDVNETQCRSTSSIPFFINSARWKKSANYFNSNYRPNLYWKEYREALSKAKLVAEQKDVTIQVEELQPEKISEEESVMGLGLRMSSIRSKQSLKKRDPSSGRGDVVDVFSDTEVEIHSSNGRRINLGFQPLMQAVQRIYRSIVHNWNDDSDVTRNVDEELGESCETETLPRRLELNPTPPTVESITERNLRSQDDSPPPPRPLDLDLKEGQDDKPLTDRMRTMNELCSRWHEVHHEPAFSGESENSSQSMNRMVEMSEDANYLVYRRGGTGANRLRRVASSESEGSTSDDSLIAGPPMIDFNEPLPNIPETDVDEAHPNPISTGDVGSTRDLDVTLPHATSNTSRENLQSVVSQLGLDIPIQNKNSCHSPQHLHSPHQSTCCRHAAHNISIESLDLDITGAAAAGGVNYCCGTPGNNKFGRRLLLTRRSCSSIH